MANICRARYLFLGQREKVLELLVQGQGRMPPEDSPYAVEHLLAQYAKQHSITEADQRTAHWRTQLVQSANQKSQEAAEELEKVANGQYESSFPKDITRRPEEEQESAAQHWLERQQRALAANEKIQAFLRQRGNHPLENNDLSRPLAERIQLLEEKIQDVNVSMLPLTNCPEAMFNQNWRLRSQFCRQFMGNRSDTGWKEEENHWSEYEDGTALFHLTSDHKWWCPVEVMKHVSSNWAGIYVGIAYLEEQGIYGHRLYLNGIEIDRVVGAIGTLPEHCSELIEEDGETWNSIKWEYTMDWQTDLITEAIKRHQS